MHNVHNTKCLCGKGIAHAHFDNYSRFHSWITCPDCSRKYHAHVFGLLPRHIPVRMPKNQLQKDINRLQWHLRQEEPLYEHDDRNSFYTDEEKDELYGPSWRTDSLPIIRWHTEKIGKILVLHRLMSLLAFKYSRKQLLIIHDRLDDSIYDATAEKILQKFHIVSEEELKECLRRTIIDYDKHKVAVINWRAAQARDEEKLMELLRRQKQEQEELERQWKECVIPWESLEAVD